MKAFYLYTIVFFLLFTSCKSLKNNTKDTQIRALNALVESKYYTIESNWANPQLTNAMQQVLNSGILQPGNSANAISLIGNSNFLTISGDSISSHLPYFGERQMHVDYGGGDSAIQLEGVLEDYTTKKGKHNRYNISFDAKSKSEYFTVNITLFPNLTSLIQITGSGRFPISYTGHVKSLKKE
ncbi:MAG: DUF4251 domain-containing protein [Algibacter sp.]|uniref:DUF4251 domain-containing protein n=1 Tax=Algibacter sp. TaxID=1872428 RepID=UPI002619D391|nr:DUF4251 domain-containing protein [Algibacter sp.]MDG1730826.1 DUF4251 domain-containing protein [Algibacter sp.]MDG2179328.1 DUF4251 domain-containing protein [Algibacter sp.]